VKVLSLPQLPRGRIGEVAKTELPNLLSNW
jgi:hypothetical protein